MLKLPLKLGGLGEVGKPDVAETPILAEGKADFSEEEGKGGGEGGEEEDELDEDDNFGILQAPAARPNPVYNPDMMAIRNPVVDKLCSDNPFPRQKAVDTPPEYFAANVRIPKKPATRSASVSDTARAAWPRGLDNPPDHQMLCTPTYRDSYR